MLTLDGLQIYFIPVWLFIGTKRTENGNPLEPSLEERGVTRSTKRTENGNPLEHRFTDGVELNRTKRTRKDAPLELTKLKDH